jgi:hypothetical protein
MSTSLHEGTAWIETQTFVEITHNDFAPSLQNVVRRTGRSHRPLSLTCTEALRRHEYGRRKVGGYFINRFQN